jgi:hypothetical protein
VKKFVLVGLFCLTVSLCFSQNQVTLDTALQNDVSYLRGRLSRNTRVAVLAVQSGGPELSDYVLRRLSAALVNDGYFTVVERNAAALEVLGRESDYQLSGYVSDETSLSVGKQLGAEIILSGELARSGAAYRLDLKAVHVETARIEAQWSQENIRPDPAWADLDRGSRTASLSFAGEALSEWDKQYFANALGRALEARMVPLILDLSPEDGSASAAYTFTVTVHCRQLPAVPPANTALLEGEITVALLRGAQVLRRAGPYRVTEMTLPLLVRRAAEQMQKDRDFFTALNGTLNP